jgi:hypothetical protein
MKKSASTFDSYENFIREFVMPLRDQGNDRLDGQTAGSSRRVAAWLRHRDDLFKVDEDSRIASLMRPFDYAKIAAIDVADALEVVRTRTQEGQAPANVTRWKLQPIPEAGQVTHFYV